MRSLILTLAFFSLATASAQQVSANFLVAKTPTHLSTDDWQTADGRGTLSTEIEGATLRGYLYQGANEGAPTILFFNSENVLVSEADAVYRALAALGPTVIVYDYRGLGFSSGKPDVARSRYDALALYDATLSSLRPDHPVVLYGFSMGSTMAAFVASQRATGTTPPVATAIPPAALILAAPMASAADELRIYARLLGNPYAASTPSPEATQVLDVPSLLARSRAPLLVIHSPADIMVPIAQGHRVFDASPSTTKQFLELPASTAHGDTPRNPATLKALKTFLAKIPNTVPPTTTTTIISH